MNRNPYLIQFLSVILAFLLGGIVGFLVSPRLQEKTTGSSLDEIKLRLLLIEQQNETLKEEIWRLKKRPVIASIASPEPTHPPATSVDFQPSITITSVPTRGTGHDPMGIMTGEVRGVEDMKNYLVVLYTMSENTWFVQPVTENPYTQIGAGGQWENSAHLGDNYGALLVRKEYEPPFIQNALPAVRGDVLARDMKKPDKN